MGNSEKPCKFFEQDCRPVECLAATLASMDFLDNPDSPNGLNVACAMGYCAKSILNAIELDEKNN